MLRIIGGVVGACLAFWLVVPPLVLFWWLIFYLCAVEIARWTLLVPLRTFLPYWLVKLVFAFPAGLDYYKNFPSLKASWKLLIVFVAEALFLGFVCWQQTEHFHDTHWSWLNWVFFGIWFLPFSDFLLQLVKEEASRDGVQLVQHRMLFKERELIHPLLQGPFPPAPEWLKTAPRWVGKASEDNPRYRVWMGFLDTALHVVRWFAWIDKKGRQDKPLGDAHVATVDDTYEAGL